MAVARRRKASDRRELHALAWRSNSAAPSSSSAMLREIAGCASPRWRPPPTPPRSATARKSRSAFSFMVRGDADLISAWRFCHLLYRRGYLRYAAVPQHGGRPGDGKVEQQASPRVLIVGAGPAGLSLAIELGQRGIACLVIERNDRWDTRRAPRPPMCARASTCGAGASRTACGPPRRGRGLPSNVVFCTRLAGVELARHETHVLRARTQSAVFGMRNGFRNTRSRACCAITPQSLPGVQIRYCCELLDLSQDADGVRARLRDLSAARNRRSVPTTWLAPARARVT